MYTIHSASDNKGNKCKHLAAEHMLFTALTKEAVFGQGIQNPRGSYEVTHGSRHSGGVNPNCHHWWPYIDVPQETVVSLQKVTKDKASKK